MEQFLLLENIIFNTIDKEIGFNLKNKLLLEKKIKELTGIYTVNKKDKGKNFRDEMRTYAYLLYFLPLNYYKLVKLLENNFYSDFNIKFNDTVNVLDIGAGPGTASLALLSYLKDNKGQDKKVNITMVDKNKKILSMGKNIIREFSNNNSQTTQIEYYNEPLLLQGLSKINRKYSVIFLANVLNEMQDRNKMERFNLLLMLFNRLLEENGIIVLMEPGTRIASRDLIALRDLLIFEGKFNAPFNIIAPCTHYNRCVLHNKDDRDWCFRSEKFEIHDTKFFEKLLFDLKMEYIFHYSYLIISKTKPIDNPNQMRIISDYIKDGDKNFYICCNSRGKTKLLTLNMKKYKRGDIAPFDSSH